MQDEDNEIRFDGDDNDDDGDERDSGKGPGGSATQSLGAPD